MNKKRTIRSLVLAVVTILIAGCIAAPTYAEDDHETDSVVAKTLMQGLAQCYNNGAFKTLISTSDVTGIDSILSSAGRTKNINIPNGLVGTLTATQISCKELLNGVSTWFHGNSSGVLINKTVIPGSFSSDAVKQQFIADMGYETVPGDTYHCVHYKYEATSTNNTGWTSDTYTAPYYTNHLCADVGPDGKIVSQLSVEKDGDSGIVEFELTKGDSGEKNSAVQLDCATYNPFSKGDCGRHDASIGTSWDQLVASILQDLAAHRATFSNTISTGEYSSYSYTYRLSTSEDVVESTSSMNYQLKSDARGIVLKAFTGSAQTPTISRDEQAQLYITYLKKIYNAQQVCGLTDNQITVYTGKGYVEYRKNADNQQCYIGGSNQNSQVNGVTNGELNHNGDDFYSIVEWLKNYTGSIDVDPETATVLDPELQTPGSSSSNHPDTDKCLSSDAAESLGWIICPILNLASRATEYLYENAVQPFLEVDAGLFKMNDSNGTFMAWTIFRDIANIIAVIFLLIVIFSQVTGLGIDNYGIKKILPKLIIAMILINLSFIVCQAFVDLSNVVGNGIKDMFDGLGGQITLASKTIEGEAVSLGDGGATATAVTSIALISVLIAFIAIPGLAAAMLPGMLMALLAAVISMLVAVLLLFALLTARQIAVVLLVAISPLAVACYMLPNTKKLFDKWLNLMKNMLILYPVCGLVIGAGNFVSRVLLRSDDLSFVMALGAMLAGVIPFFFIPALVKGAMNVFGNLGGKLAGFGKNMGGRAKGAVANSERMKEFQQQSRLKADKARATRLNARISAAGGNASERLKRKAGIINQRVAQGEARNTRNASWGSKTRLQAAQQNLERQDAEAAIQDNMTLISNNEAFDAEAGDKFYSKMVAARDAGNDAEADAYIELAMKNGKAAAKFMEKMRTDSTRVLDRKSASRIMRGSNTGILKAVDGIGYQYAREVDTGKVSGVDAATWSGNIDNIKTAIEKNINNAGAYASQSASVHEVLNTNKAALSTTPAGSSGVSGAQLMEELEYYAAEAAETSADASKIAVYSKMRENTSLPGGIRQTRTREAQEAQTAAQVAAATAQTSAINAAAATASADAAAIRSDIAAVRAPQVTQNQAPQPLVVTHTPTPPPQQQPQIILGEQASAEELRRAREQWGRPNPPEQTS